MTTLAATGLQTLIAQIESSAHDDPAVSVLVSEPRLFSGSTSGLQALGLQRPPRPSQAAGTSPLQAGKQLSHTRAPGTRPRPYHAAIPNARGAALAVTQYAQAPQGSAAVDFLRSPTARAAAHSSRLGVGSVATGTAPPSFPVPRAVGAPSIATSAGVGVGAGALALLALVTLPLLPVLLLGRLGFDPFSLKSALLTSRLERPG